MNFYDLMMYPLEKNMLGDKRAWLMSKISGNILEIGYGTGANSPFINFENITHLTALDLNHEYRVEHPKVSFIEGAAEAMPFKDATFDTVIETLVLCSVDNLDQTLNEIYRVLKPGGRFIYMDHVLPENDKMARAFKVVNPLWSKIAHGCNLTRLPYKELEKHGFTNIENQRFGKTIFSYGIAQKL